MVLTFLELDTVGREGKVDIFRTSESNSEYALAKWIIKDSQVVGLHFEAKVYTSFYFHQLYYYPLIYLGQNFRSSYH